MLWKKLKYKFLYSRPVSVSYNRRLGPFYVKLAVSFIILFICASVLLVRVRPLAVKMAEARASDIVTMIVNEASTEKLKEGRLDFTNLVDLVTDEYGIITARSGRSDERSHNTS